MGLLLFEDFPFIPSTLFFDPLPKILGTHPDKFDKIAIIEMFFCPGQFAIDK